MTLSEAIAETMRRAEKDQEFLRKTLEKRRREAVPVENGMEPKLERFKPIRGEPTERDHD